MDGRFDFGGGLTGTISTIQGNGSSARSGDARIFDTTRSGTHDPDLESPTAFGGGASASLGNVLIVSESNSRVDDNAGGGTITFMFDTMVDFFGVTLVDLERHQPIRVTATGYDSGLQSNADNTYSSLLTGGIATNFISFNFVGSGAIDNLDVSVSQVPLPMSGFLLLGGMGMLAAKRRKRV